MGVFSTNDSSGLYARDKDGNKVEIIETYLTNNKVWVRNEDGSSKVIPTRDLRR